MHNTGNKYHRDIIGLDGNVTKVDVYRVLDAFDVRDPGLQHLIKKALCSGLRGHKDLTQDLEDIVDAAVASLELQKQKSKWVQQCESPNTFPIPNSAVDAVPVSLLKATSQDPSYSQSLSTSALPLGVQYELPRQSDAQIITNP